MFMDLEKQIEEYKKMIQSEPREEKIQETIRKSKEAFLLAEQQRMLTFHEFVWSQFKLIRKRWWLFQLCLLLLLWGVLLSIQDDRYVQRSMGIIASLFVILIIPEIWKNRIHQSMEIESASYYSLRQIYAARMLIFGAVDTLLLTVFLGMTISVLNFSITELLIEFLFPMTITACICLRTLCSNRLTEMAAVTLCILWSTIWLLIVLNDNVYSRITIPIWSILLMAALIYLGIVIYQILKKCTNYWEEPVHGIEIK